MVLSTMYTISVTGGRPDSGDKWLQDREHDPLRRHRHHPEWRPDSATVGQEDRQTAASIR